MHQEPVKEYLHVAVTFLLTQAGRPFLSQAPNPQLWYLIQGTATVGREGSSASPKTLLLLFFWFQPIPGLKATTHSYAHHVPIILSTVFRTGYVFISI